MEIGSKTFQEFIADSKENFCIVVLGAGGSLEEWIKGIEGKLKESSITSAEKVFTRAYTLSDNVRGKEGRIDLILVFDPAVKPDMGKMAIWRLGWDGAIGWTEDFITNHGKDYGHTAVDEENEEEEPAKPHAKLTGEDGNVFSIIGRVSKALKKAGQEDKAKEFTDKAFNAGSYDEVLRLAMTYCDVS
jgi:hypothetical protein